MLWITVRLCILGILVFQGAKCLYEMSNSDLEWL